jgi:hypothetical protein
MTSARLHGDRRAWLFLAKSKLVFVHFLGFKESSGLHICLQERPLAGTCAFFIPQRDIDLPLKHPVLGSKGEKKNKNHI